MNKFKLTVDGDSLRQHNIEVLREVIFNLKDDTDSFVILDPKTPINNSIYLQAIKQEDKYIAETRFVFDNPNDFKHYSKEYKTPEELFELFAEYYKNQQLPNIRNWVDESKSLSNNNDSRGDEMVKLYKTYPTKTSYFEVWLNDDEMSLTIHTGEVGHTGMTEDVFYDEEGDLPVKVAMNQLIVAQKEMGYDTVSLTELIVQYTFGSDKKSDLILTEKEQIEILLNECLGWTGNGHCEGGDAESEIVNLFCYVVDKEIAIDTILKAIEENGLPQNLKIAYADEKTEEYISLYPVKGEFFSLF